MGYLTTMAAQPMQIDSALQALLNASAQKGSGQSDIKYDSGTPANVDVADQHMEGNESTSSVAPPFPDSVEDVSMESGVDKRSSESPDSTLKPEGKSLKTPETASATTATDTNEVSTGGSMKPSNVTKRPKTVPEVKSLMWEVHHRMPAWKADKLLEFHKTDQVDLAALGEATGILFESKEMLNEAVLHLDKIRKAKDGKEDADLGVPEESDPHSSQSCDQDMSNDKRSDDLKKKKTSSAAAGTASVVPNATGSSDGTNNQDSESSSKNPTDTNRQQGATASSTDSVTEEKKESVSESHEDWLSRVTKVGQEVLWHSEASAKRPTLLTGVQPSNLKSLETLGWEDKLESADTRKSIRSISVEDSLLLFLIPWKLPHGRTALFLKHTDYHPMSLNQGCYRCCHSCPTWCQHLVSPLQLAMLL